MIQVQELYCLLQEEALKILKNYQPTYSSPLNKSIRLSYSGSHYFHLYTFQVQVYSIYSPSLIFFLFRFFYSLNLSIVNLHISRFELYLVMFSIVLVLKAILYNLFTFWCLDNGSSVLSCIEQDKLGYLSTIRLTFSLYAPGPGTFEAFYGSTKIFAFDFLGKL